MNLSAIPYLLVSRELELMFGVERVFVCMCLIDHLIMGVGKDRQAAMAAMVREFEGKYGDGLPDDGLEFDNCDLN